MLSRYVTDIVLDFLKVAYSQKMFHFDSKKAAKSLLSTIQLKRKSSGPIFSTFFRDWNQSEKLSEIKPPLLNR